MLTWGGPAMQPWESLAANGGSVSGIGANIWGTTNDLHPVSGSINGVACTLVAG